MKRRLASLICLFTCLFALPASAHFGMVLPSSAVVSDNRDATVRLTLSFWHPYENTGMNLEKPASFLLYHDSKITDLTSTLRAAKARGFDVWTSEYTLARPGLHTFVMTPKPYWEPAEDCFIVHYAKVQVAGFGEDSGWDAPLGLPVEIAPLSKPYALYTGNIFQGRVLMDGKTAAHAAVEVEFYPGEKLKGIAPNDLMVTQTVKADADGVFSYAAPRAGWWGFAALRTAPDTLDHQGTAKPVEQGGVIWVYFADMPKPAILK